MSVTPSTRQLQSVVAGHVAGTGWGQQFIAEEAFALVNTYGEKFGYETWGNEGLEDVGDAIRAINADTQTVDPPKNSYVEDSLDEYALQTKIDKRLINNARVNDRLRAASGASIEGMSGEDRLRVGRARRLHYNNQIQKEKAAAAIAFVPASFLAALHYGAGGGQAAIDFAAAGLIKKIAEAKRAVTRLFGFEPDTFILGYTKFLDLWNNSDVLARITGGASNANPAIVNHQLLAQLFGVKRFLVGSAVTQALAEPGEAPTAATDLWTPTTASLIYTGEAETADTSSPAFGKMFYMDVPETGVRYDVRTWDSDNGKLEFLEATEFAKPKLIMKAGAIFTT